MYFLSVQNEKDDFISVGQNQNFVDEICIWVPRQGSQTFPINMLFQDFCGSLKMAVGEHF